ncbi:MFS transporter, DHA2 family, multidrug resistance protein [Thermostaphylospora chromogena]|uniref:MFS transporter, DHA2 family, multidrug resistance protein n=1 Tax=Thermostaphylospora chromogena TaxID=35622 RepID=A0A1H1CSJ9_9ACTN|nr:MFS transporter, DHA2 family, multidrug resistance protein [Thermostaphylospora chromogena]
MGLLVVLGPVLLVSMDGSILFLTMPTITHALAPTADQALWILDSYGFAVGSLLIAFGNIGDRFGRLKLLMIGVTVFGLGSAGAAFSTSPEWLIGCRVLMGLGGATLLPSGLAVLSELFTNPRQRSQAIGIFAATFAAGFAIGPVIGGLLLSRFEWGSVFLINLPVVVVFLAAAPFVLREVKATRPGGVDVLSILLSAGGLLAVVYAIKKFAAYGPSWSVLAFGVVGVLVLIGFVLRQRRLEYPLVDVALFREKVFSVAIITGVLSLVVWSAAAYLTGIYLQTVLDLSVLTAALLALPGAAVLTTVCITTPRIAARIGERRALALCYFSMAAGLVLLLATTTTGGIGWYIASTVVAGVGYGISFALVADTAVAAVPADRAGAAGAIAETSNEIGNALGIALLGSIAALVFRLFGPGLAPTLSETLDLAGTASVVAEAKSAFLTGLHVAMALGAVLCVGMGALTLRWIPKTGGSSAVD